jgi:hypothetical protein
LDLQRLGFERETREVFELNEALSRTIGPEPVVDDNYVSDVERCARVLPNECVTSETLNETDRLKIKVELRFDRRLKPGFGELGLIVLDLDFVPCLSYPILELERHSGDVVESLRRRGRLTDARFADSELDKL